MAAGIEGCVWETLMNVLVQNVSELVPYTLQVIAQLLDALPPRAEGQHLPERYAQLIGPLLSAELRTERGNIPAIIRLLTACIRYDANAFTAHIEAIVDLATSLIAAKSLDHEGFNLAIAVAMHMPRETSDAVLSRIFVAGMQRLQHSKTPKVERAFAVFGAVVFLCRGVEYVAGMLEQVQAGLFQLFVRRLMLLAAPRVDGLVPRRTVLNAVTSLVACPQVQQTPPLFSECVLTGLKLVHFAVEAEVPEAGGSSLRRVVSASTLPQVASIEDATRLDNLAEAGGSNAFTPLTGAARPLADPVPTITSATGHFREVAKATLAAQPQLVEALRSSLPGDAFAAVCNL
jgi:exportin-2 (importin alpha re-exporter)